MLLSIYRKILLKTLRDIASFDLLVTPKARIYCGLSLFRRFRNAFKYFPISLGLG